MTTLELCTKHPKAYEALPEAYQGADCLYFFEEDGMLLCEPAEGQEVVLGQWTAIYSSGRWKQFA